MKDRTRYLSALTAFVLLIGMASAGTVVTSQYIRPRGSDGTASEENVTLSGIVTDGTDGIAGAEIALYGGDVFICDLETDMWPPYWAHTTETAEDGTFEIELPAGNYSFNVIAEGYEHYYEWIDIDADKEVEIVLDAYTSVLSGHVMTEDGDAIADAYISVYTAWDWRDDDWISYGEKYDGAACVIPDIEYHYFFAYTDEEGFYTLYGYPGEYEISVWAYGYSSVDDRIELAEGDNEMDFVLGSQSAHVEGWVYGDDTGEPVGGALVTLEYFPVFGECGAVRSDYCREDIDIWDGVEILFHYTTETDDEGWFEFELEADEMWMYGYLTVEAEGYEVYETDVFISEHVELEVLLEPDDGGGNGGDVVKEYEYEYIDENDDGYPEYIYEHRIVYKGYWLIYEYEYIYEDEDSDGNPEYEYERETGTDVEHGEEKDPVKEGDRDDDRAGVFIPFIPDDNGGKEVGDLDDQDDGDTWSEDKGSQGAGDDVHARGIALVMTIGLVGAAFLFIIGRR